MPRVAELWEPGTPGLVLLPSGRIVRGRGLRKPLPGGQRPTFGLYLLGRQAPTFPWESRWLRWPDFGLPADAAALVPALSDAWERAESGRVEFACAGGRGRTGTALACLAILDGVPPREAVAFVRARYERHAVETPWQRRFVSTWRGELSSGRGRAR
jgi:protein-tyrosine phosphatase